MTHILLLNSVIRSQILKNIIKIRFSKHTKQEVKMHHGYRNTRSGRGILAFSLFSDFLQLRILRRRKIARDLLDNILPNLRYDSKSHISLIYFPIKQLMKSMIQFRYIIKSNSIRLIFNRDIPQ